MNDYVWKRPLGIKFSWKQVLRLFYFLGTLFLFTYFYHQLKTEKYFPISNVAVAGVHYADSREIQHLLVPLVDKGFFSLDVELIKERLLQLPWILDASVQKTWPNKVTIRITEKIPAAVWNGDSLLSSTGEIFRPAVSSYPSDLPQLAGALGDQIAILDNFEKINSLIAPLHLKIARFELLPSHTFSLTLENGMKIKAGYKDVLTHIGHFVKVYSKVIGDRAALVDYVDLRYPNGLAVRWKKSV